MTNTEVYIATCWAIMAASKKALETAEISMDTFETTLDEAEAKEESCYQQIK